MMFEGGEVMTVSGHGALENTLADVKPVEISVYLPISVYEIIINWLPYLNCPIK